MWRKRILALGALLFGATCIFNLLTWAYLRVDLHDSRTKIDFSRFENPYKRNIAGNWLKAGMHLHTNRTWFTPGRNSPQEIESVYSDNGYRVLGFTDYERITKSDSPQLLQITGYEWGMNLRKRHLSVFGSGEIRNDLFPLYADEKNLQWVIQELKEDNGFVVINHPFLNDSFSLDTLSRLRNYDALEVFSPFGDIPKFWDILLGQKIPSFCMASDDLHYLPREEYVRTRTSGLPNWRDLSSEIYRQEGESLMRYILINTPSSTEKDVLESLQEGNYLCVRKMERSLPDPKVLKIGKNDDEEIFYEFEDTPITVDFIGPNSEVLGRTSYEKKGTYRMRPSDSYIRIQAIFPTAIILSNPFFQER